MLSLSLLVDSVADDSFIDESVARQAGLPLVALAEPKVALDEDGRSKTHKGDTPHSVSNPLSIW